MISIGKVSNSGYQSKHLTGDDKNAIAEYYSGEDVPSAWKGSLAEQQGWSGRVDEKDFAAALAGRVEDATGQRDMSEERSNRTAGFDMTIEAPKSVSIEALVNGNEDALKAHHAAVDATLEKLESGMSTRITDGGKTRNEQTGNMAAATFEHHGSAAGDPHLHTHVVVANATVADDGKARTIDARESIYNAQTDLNRTYNETLQKELEARGIATYTDKNGATQIQGYDVQGMREFSSRQQAIEQRLEKDGFSYDKASAEQRELARQETRKDIDKTEPKSRDETVNAWREKAEEATARGGKVGPAEKAEIGQGANAEKPGKGEGTQYSREEFREAKWAVNEGKAAEARLDAGNYRTAEHKDMLEARVERMETLKAEKPDLYDRAERAVEKMGVRDPDAKVDAADAARVEKLSADLINRGRDAQPEGKGTGIGDAAEVARQEIKLIGDAASALRQDLAHELQTKAEREKAIEEGRERERIEETKKADEQRQAEAREKQAKVEAAGGTQAQDAPAERDDKKRDEEAKQQAQDRAGKDNYALAESERLIAERREAQAQKTDTAAGSDRDRSGQTQESASAAGARAGAEDAGRPTGSALSREDMGEARKMVDGLAESVLRRAGYDQGMKDAAMKLDAGKVDLKELAEFVEKYGNTEQRNQMRELLEKHEKIQAVREDEAKKKERSADGYAR